jgi:hypothetical protein
MCKPLSTLAWVAGTLLVLLGQPAVTHAQIYARPTVTFPAPRTPVINYYSPPPPATITYSSPGGPVVADYAPPAMVVPAPYSFYQSPVSPMYTGNTSYYYSNSGPVYFVPTYYAPPGYSSSYYTPGYYRY